MINYLLIAICLIFLDKLSTAITIIKVGKKYPNKDKFSIEKNPLALYFFKKFGLAVGSFLYGIFSLFSFYFSVWLLNFLFSWKIGFMIVSIIYVLVLLNNFRWLIKYSK